MFGQSRSCEKNNPNRFRIIPMSIDLCTNKYDQDSIVEFTPALRYSVLVLRILVIMTLLLGNIPRVGINLSGLTPNPGCTIDVCQPIEMLSSCCSQLDPSINMNEYCPMSGGPCQCVIVPIDEQDVDPNAPMQRAELQLNLRMHIDPDQLCIWSTLDDQPVFGLIDRVENRIAHQSHTETQAILGVWTT